MKLGKLRIIFPWIPTAHPVCSADYFVIFLLFSHENSCKNFKHNKANLQKCKNTNAFLVWCCKKCMEKLQEHKPGKRIKITIFNTDILQLSHYKNSPHETCFFLPFFLMFFFYCVKTMVFCFANSFLLNKIIILLFLLLLRFLLCSFACNFFELNNTVVLPDENFLKYCKK